jgi:hypothetical protein
MAVIINPYTIPSFFAGIISLVLGIYAYYKNPKEKSTQVFFLLMLGCSIWSLTPIIMQAQLTAENALIWAKISNAGLLIIPVVLFHFSFIFRRKMAVKFKKIVPIYILAIIMIILLFGTNEFFTMANDKLIDGDGVDSNGRGDGDYDEEHYIPILELEIASFYYIDTNDDDLYTISNEYIEPLRFGNQTLVGTPGNDTWLQLNSSNNHILFFYVDHDGSGNYTIGESIFLENGDGDQKLIFNYVAGSLYLLLMIYFFGFIILSIANFFIYYRSVDDSSIKASIKFLIAGLIAIMVFILSPLVLASFIPAIILDSAIALIIAIFFTVAVLKYNIVDIKLILRKSMFYSAASVIVVIIFVIVEEGMEMIFSNFAFSGSVFSGIIAAFVALIIFSVVKKGLRNQTDKLFPSVRLLDKEYQNRIAAYKATITAMLSDGMISKKEKSAINILRDKLEIHPNEHKQLLRELKLELKKQMSTGGV